MCRRVTCETCGKPTFAGCGAHIEQVLGDVPKDKRCTCREDRAAGRIPERAQAAPGGAKGWWPFK